MASILILGVKIPFTSGGQEALVRSLQKELKARGHTVDIVEVPFNVLPKEGMPHQCAMWRNFDFSSFGGQKVDLIICTKFPSYYAKHENKSIWLVHQHRSLYDLYGTRFSDFSDDPRDEALREMLVEGDNKVIGEAKFVSGISRNVVKRLKTFNNITAQHLYPPLPLGNRYYTGEQQNYILSVGRLCSIKRVDLMIKALPMVHNFVKLKIVGTPDEPGIAEYFKNEIDKHHLWDRVEFLGRVTDEELIELYANALVVYYAPFQEDYGYVTLEAFASGKPVISAIDSGGVLEFVKHQENAIVTDPTIDAMSKAANILIEDKALAQKLGAAGLETVRTLGLLEHGWDQVIEGLLSPLTTKQ